MLIWVRVDTETLTKQCSIRWSVLSPWMACYLQGQNIRRNSEDQVHIHMHETGTTMFIKVLRILKLWQINIGESALCPQMRALMGPGHPKTLWRPKFIYIKQEIQCFSECMSTLKPRKYNIQMSVEGLAPYGSGHSLALWKLIPCVWNWHYNVFQSKCWCWNLDKQYSVRWSVQSMWMAWHLRGQDIHKHSEHRSHMHDTWIKVFIKVIWNAEIFSKQYPFGWSAPDLWMAWHLRGQEIHRHSGDQIHMQETGTKMNIKIMCVLWSWQNNTGEYALCLWMAWPSWGQATGQWKPWSCAWNMRIQWLSEHMWKPNPWQNSLAFSTLSGEGLAPYGVRTSTCTVKINFIHMK